MKIFYQVWCIIFGMLVFVSACVPPTVFPAVTSDILPSPLEPSATQLEPSPTITDKPTRTPVPTSTLRPTQTPTITLTPGPIIDEPYVPPTIPPATVSAEATIEAVLSPCGNGEQIRPWQGIESLSPNGQWAAFQCYSEELGTYANIIQIDGSISWQVSYKQTYAANNENARGIAALVIPFHWSADGRYFYLTIHIDAMDGPGLFLVNGHALFRLDLINGQISEVLPPIPFLSYSMSISPNSRFLVYVEPRETSKFYIRDFRTGQEKAYALPDEFDLPAFFVWSEDSKQLVFSVAHESFNDGDDFAGMGLFLLDRDTDIVSLLLHEPPTLYYPTSWLSPTQIYVAILWEGYHQSPYIFDLETMKLTPVTTPQP